MPLFRYTATGTWFKGNTHIHSTASDGGCTFPELAQMYGERGFQFLFRTDHWVASDVAADAAAYPLLWMDGIELDGSDHGGSHYHVVGLGTVRGMDRSMGLVAAMEAARAQGALLILAHPLWTGNSLEDALRYRFDGIEVYNHVCRWLNGKSDGSAHWAAMLNRFPATLGIAADDAHTRPEHPGWNGAWVMVNAPALTREAILASIRAGNFYSTLGPEFRSIRLSGSQVTVETSPVQFIRLVGPAWCGKPNGSFDGRALTTATFTVPADWSYAYIELEDAQGRRAWTNTLFTGE